MLLKILATITLVVIGSRPAYAQTAVAVIESIYADSAGHAIRRDQPLSSKSLDSLLTSLKDVRGATIWFSWSGGPTKTRTVQQEHLLAQLRASGIRVELRSDSTFHSRVIRP